MINFLILIGAVVCVVAFLLTIAIRKQLNKELDKGINLTTVKHPLLANPIVIAYVLFPVIVVVGAIIWAILKL